MTCDPIAALTDKELVRLVREAYEPLFNRHEREWLEELIHRFEEAAEALSNYGWCP